MEYIKRISREFKTADERGELDLMLFGINTRKKLQILMRSPQEYYQKYAKYDLAKKELDPAAQRLKEIENSTTYRVGRTVMTVPIAAKNTLDVIRRELRR